MSAVTTLKTIKVTCDNPYCDFVKYYPNTTLKLVKICRKILSRIPYVSDECQHVHVTFYEVELQ